MKKQEVLNLLTQRGLKEVKKRGRVIKFVDEDKIYYDNQFHNLPNVFGVYYNVEYSIYKFFVTDNERGGMIEYSHNYNTEDEAYSGMYEYVDRLYRTYSH